MKLSNRKKMSAPKGKVELPKFKVTIEDALRSTPEKELRMYAECILDIEESYDIPFDELVAKVAERYHKDVWECVSDDLLIFDSQLEDYLIRMLDGFSVQIEKSENYARCVFSDLTFIEVREVNEGNRVLTYATMAEEVRDALNANPHRYEDLRCLNGDVDMYAESATELYGVVTIKELCEIYRRWNAETWVTEEMAREILQFLEQTGDTEYFLHDDYVCHREFDCKKDTDEIIEDFLESISDKPRWFPETEDEFLNFCDESVYLMSDAAKALGEFLERHGVKDGLEREDMLYEVIQKNQFGEGMSECFDVVLKRCNLRGDDVVECVELLAKFMNNIHLRDNNGWTPDEMYKKFSTPVVNAAPKVGRNDLCPCGSGKKYKKCCGKGG